MSAMVIHENNRRVSVVLHLGQRTAEASHRMFTTVMVEIRKGGKRSIRPLLPLGGRWIDFQEPVSDAEALRLAAAELLAAADALEASGRSPVRLPPRGDMGGQSAERTSTSGEASKSIGS